MYITHLNNCYKAAMHFLFMIIGVTGSYGSGKDTAVEFFKQRGFVHFSLSEILREELTKEGLELTRENQIDKGNQLRKEFGNGILARRIIEKLDNSKDYVLSSIRNSGEIEELKKATKEFLLINLDAEPLLRFQRTQQRHTSTIDPKIFEQFLENEKRESVSSDGAGQELKKCAEMADVTVANNGSVEDFYKKLGEQLEEFKTKMTYRRPGWDEYFISIMDEVGKRGTCDRGRSGSIIVKEKRLLTTGYVGSPIGLKHCDETGHLMVDVIDESGTTRKHCIRTAHAEQNAIIQAARFGISIDGATVYAKMEPCHACAKMIINAGIKRVVCKKRYHAGKLTRELFKEAGVQLDVLDDSIEEYKNQ